eukprot:scaffold9850_cov93-Isochrysis_galbana.AAC.3
MACGGQHLDALHRPMPDEMHKVTGPPLASPPLKGEARRRAAHGQADFTRRVARRRGELGRHCVGSAHKLDVQRALAVSAGVGARESLGEGPVGRVGTEEPCGLLRREAEPRPCKVVSVRAPLAQ